MELKKSFDLRRVFISVYVLFFVAFLIIGLQPAEATQYEISAELYIPSIGLTSSVTTLHLKNHQLEAPATIVGSFTRHPSKTLLIGHASTVFQNLAQANTGDSIIYDDATYRIVNRQIIEKTAVSMSQLLSPAEQNTLIIMTCAGTDLGHGDATHRLIITATAS